MPTQRPGREEREQEARREERVPHQESQGEPGTREGQPDTDSSGGKDLGKTDRQIMRQTGLDMGTEQETERGKQDKAESLKSFTCKSPRVMHHMLCLVPGSEKIFQKSMLGGRVVDECMDDGEWVGWMDGWTDEWMDG